MLNKRIKITLIIFLLFVILINIRYWIRDYHHLESIKIENQQIQNKIKNLVKNNKATVPSPIIKKNYNDHELLKEIKSCLENTTLIMSGYYPNLIDNKVNILLEGNYFSLIKFFALLQQSKLTYKIERLKITKLSHNLRANITLINIIWRDY